MTHYMYIAIQEDDKIATFTVDPDTGALSHQRDLAVSGGPFTMAVSPTEATCTLAAGKTPN